MKRDMELVRKLLIDISDGYVKKEANYNLEEDRIYDYHLQIMRQADLISYRESGYKGGTFYVDEPKLTWSGNDYLDAVSNDTVWGRTKNQIKEKGMELSSVPMSVLKDLAILQLKSYLGME